MKTKIKKKKRKIYECFQCGEDFCHKPYHVHKNYEESLVFCKRDCWKTFSDMTEQLYKEIFQDEVLLSYPVQQFIDYLKDYVDYKYYEFDLESVQFSYKDVLKYIEDSIKESRTKK